MYRKYKKPWSMWIDETTNMPQLLLFLDLCGYSVHTSLLRFNNECSRSIAYRHGRVLLSFGDQSVRFKDVDDLIKRHMKLSEKDAKKNEEV